MFKSWFDYFNPQQLVDMQNFKKFLLDNNIVATTAGVLIAYSAWDFIQSFVGDLALPGIYFLFIKRFISNNFISSVFEPVNKLNLPKFISRLFSFAIVIIFTFLVIQYIIKNWLSEITISNATTLPTASVAPSAQQGAGGNISIQVNAKTIKNEMPTSNIKYSDFSIDSFVGRTLL